METRLPRVYLPLLPFHSFYRFPFLSFPFPYSEHGCIGMATWNAVVRGERVQLNAESEGMKMEMCCPGNWPWLAFKCSLRRLCECIDNVVHKSCPSCVFSHQKLQEINFPGKLSDANENRATTSLANEIGFAFTEFNAIKKWELSSWAHFCWLLLLLHHCQRAKIETISCDFLDFWQTGDMPFQRGRKNRSIGQLAKR